MPRLPHRSALPRSSVTERSSGASASTTAPTARRDKPSSDCASASFGKALPAGYIEDVTPEVAADDVIRLAALKGEVGIGLNLYLHQQECFWILKD